MMYIGIPNLGFDDFSVLEKLSKNKKLSSIGLLSANLIAIQNSYKEYESVSGNPWKLSAPLTIPAVLAEALKVHYDNEVEGLEFISTIRNELRNDSCPMCGSTLPPEEVDHVIPKHVYPEFSIFSLNLVSACSCNHKKGRIYKGESPGERVLHPYFDNIMSERLVYLSFSESRSKPNIQIALCSEYSENAALKFHVNEILKKTALLRHADNTWGKFSDRPGLTLRRCSEKIGKISLLDFQKELWALIDEHDYRHGTPNNWNSMFYYGLLKAPLHLGLVYQRLCDGW